MDSKHTPGPWKWMVNGEEVNLDTYEAPGYYRNPELRGPNGEGILTCDEYQIHKEPDDARLIASAPELLAALRELVAECDEHPGWEGHRNSVGFEMARAAIARAEGH